MSSLPGVTFTETNIQRLFGNEAAENEPIEVLRSYYFKGKAYEQLSEQLPLRILVGHKGVGKSALFKIAFDEDAAKGCFPVFIKPDDILDLASQDNGNLLSLIRDWKQGLVEIIRRKILDELEFDEANAGPVANLTTRFFPGILGALKSIRDSSNLDMRRLSLVTRVVENRKIVIYIDDLDRGWEGRALDIKRISALLNAARDLSSDNAGLMFRIALRTDVYFLVRTSDESTDKVGSSVIWYSWENHEIYILLVKRILAFYGHAQPDDVLLNMSQSELSIYLDRVMTARFNGIGKWRDIPTYRMLMSLIRRRPRDLVKLCTLAARRAYLDNSTKMETRHFTAIFEEYSQDRIQDTINEFRTELPQVERLLLEMKPSKKQKSLGLGAGRQGRADCCQVLRQRVDITPLGVRHGAKTENRVPGRSLPRPQPRQLPARLVRFGRRGGGLREGLGRSKPTGSGRLLLGLEPFSGHNVNWRELWREN